MRGSPRGFANGLTPQDATRYLIGEKLLRSMEASGDHPEFSAEMPRFIARIKEIFSRGEIVEFFQDAESRRVSPKFQAERTN